ncbi:LysR substrate-binding domain-containing protein [Deinococcus sp.]|uniref:LysR family transcriptional regulator n=1 Tax=Deinococcus sp. TaxID=47478 RepID=UPI003C7AF368
MELRQLRLFLAVAQEGNFTRAAERVNLSQPALSHRIRGLEDELGVPLFLRTARGAELTPAGEVLRLEAERLLGDAALTVQRVRRAGGRADDHLRVGFDHVEFGSVPPMPILLGAFRERFPEAQVTVQTLEPKALEEALLGERLDIAFLLGPPLRPELGFYPLLHGTYRAVLPGTHRLTEQATLSRSDLRAERLLLPPLNSRNEASLLAWLGEAGRVSRAVDVASFAGLTLAGEGLGLLPSGLLPLSGTAGLSVRPLDQAPGWVFGLAWRTGQPLPFADLAQRLIRPLVPQIVEVDASEQPISDAQTP